MNAPPSPLAARPPAPLSPPTPPARAGQPGTWAKRALGVTLSWLRFMAMAAVGVLGVWLLVLLFG